MALRPAALQVAGAMGFPGPMGGGAAATPPAPAGAADRRIYNYQRIYDYGLCDATVVPDQALVPGGAEAEAGQASSVPEEAKARRGAAAASSSPRGGGGSAVGAAAWGWGEHGEHHALRLPGTYFVCDHARPDPGLSAAGVWRRPPPVRRDLGLPENATVLVCMNRGHKVGRAGWAAPVLGSHGGWAGLAAWAGVRCD